MLLKLVSWSHLLTLFLDKTAGSYLLVDDEQFAVVG